MALSLPAILISLATALGIPGGVLADGPRAEPGAPMPQAGPLTFSDSTLDLGVMAVNVGTVGYVTVRNAGDAPVTGLTIAITLPVPQPSPFSIASVDSPCDTGSLPAGRACEIVVEFTPTAVGATPPATLQAVGVVGGQPVETAIPVTGWGSTWAVHALPAFVNVGRHGLAMTHDPGDARYLHAVAARVEAMWDSTFYARTYDEGTTWGQTRLLEGINPQLAASGSHVYLVVESFRRCRGGVGFRLNAEHGASVAWSRQACLTTRGVDVEAPSIAAIGRRVYVASSDNATGQVLVHISRDHGRTWGRDAVGVARIDGGPGGPVAVAASGRVVAIAWSYRGDTYARVSHDSGRHWGRRARLADGWLASGTSDASRLAFSGMHRRDAWVRVWTRTGGWVAVDAPGTAVALGPGGRIGVVELADRPGVAGVADTAWTMSIDNGVTWTEPERLPVGTAEASVLWLADGRVYALAHLDDEVPALAVRPASLAQR